MVSPSSLQTWRREVQPRFDVSPDGEPRKRSFASRLGSSCMTLIFPVSVIRTVAGPRVRIDRLRVGCRARRRFRGGSLFGIVAASIQGMTC